MTCPHCKHQSQIYKEEKIVNAAKKYMLKASCPSCERWIKWLSFQESKTLSSEEIKAMYDHNTKIERGGT